MLTRHQESPEGTDSGRVVVNQCSRTDDPLWDGTGAMGLSGCSD